MTLRTLIAISALCAGCQPNGSHAPASDPVPNAVDVDSDTHTVELENDRVRIIDVVYPEGYETPVHSHLAGVNVFLHDRRATRSVDGAADERST